MPKTTEPTTRFDIKTVNEINVAHWMHNQGHTSYLREVQRIERMIILLQAKKADILREAYDRFQDWATDPLE